MVAVYAVYEAEKGAEWLPYELSKDLRHWNPKPDEMFYNAFKAERRA